MKRKRKDDAYHKATELLRQPDYLLMNMMTNTKHGRQFYIVGKAGGPVDEEVAKKLLAHPLCREVDSGLFPGIPQTYSLCSGRTE